MKIAIVGSGALGGFYGAMLARKGHDVHFLMRNDYEMVRKNGLFVRSKLGDFHLAKVNCYDKPDQIGPVDLVLVGLKTTANHMYEPLIRPLVKPQTIVLTAQNGLGNEEKLAELFGEKAVAGGMAFLCANRTTPGVIEHLDYGHMHIATYKPPADEKLYRFAEMLEQSSIECKVMDDLAKARWSKLLWNVPFSGLSTLLDVTVDEVVGDAEIRNRAKELMDEVLAAAAACGARLSEDFPAKMMAATDRMEPYYTSMHLDRLAGRPMEIESIVGEPLRRGLDAGVKLRQMQLLYDGLLKLDTDNRNANR